MTLAEGTALGALAVAVLNGVLVFVRTRGADSKSAGVDAQRLADLEKRVTKAEADVHDMNRSVADIRVTLAAIPEQLKGQKELMTMQFEALNHGIKNLRMAVEAVAKLQPH